MRRAILIAALFAAALTAAEPFFFIQLSDTQFGMYAKDENFAQETANFQFAVATIKRLKPKFVVITGDLVNKPGDATQIAEYLRICSTIDPSVKVYHVAGNHDVGNEPTKESLDAYRHSIGRDYYSFQEGDLVGIVLNSQLIQHPEKVPSEFDAQETWLRSELARARESGAKHIVVFQHQPWFIESPDEADQYFNIPAERRAGYLALLREFGVRQVFAGHYHRNAGGRSGSLEMITTGPIGMPIDGAKSGMRIVAVKDTGIVHKFYDLGDLPNTVDASASRPLK